MSSERLSEFLSVFSNSIQEEILDFCRRISSTEADVYIFLARKAAVFCDCLEELGQIHLDGYITTDRSLDIDSKWLKGKNVVIIDDAVVSGTTLYSIINKLENANVKNITVQILTINKRWFNEELLENDLGESYIYPTYNKLSDNLCIKLCNEIVQAVSIIPRPYDIDFPLYKRFTISEFEFDRILSLNNWISYDNRTCMQKEHNIINTTLIPCDSERKQINKIFGFDFTHNTIVKIRLYGRIIDKEKRAISLRIVPMIVFNYMDCSFADQVFELMISIVGNKDIFKEWSSCSKLRLIQFYYSNQLAKYWFSCANHVFDCDHELIFSRRNLTFLFPSHLISSVEKICNILIKIPIGKGLRHHNDVRYKEISSNFNAVDPISVNARLYEPFLDMYHNKEIPCRSLVLQHGKRVYQKKEYDELINRLNVGLSYSDLLNRMNYCSSEYNIERIVSSFIDRSIDAGIIVPIFQQEGKTVFRAYRHGEDVLFGCREELMYRKMLTLFYEYSGSDNGITRMETEKLIVLFTKIGLKEKILNPYTSNFISEPVDKNGNVMKILSIKPYLRGPVSLLGSARKLQKNKYIPYITNERKGLWMTNVLVQNGTLVKRSNAYKYEITKTDKNVEADFELLTDKEKSFVQNFSELTGRISNPSCDTGVVYDDTDWARISVTLTLSDTVNAVAAEMEIFYNNLDLTNVLYFSGDKKNDYEEIKHYVGSYAFESIHSAGMKIESYTEKKGQDLINSVKFQSNIEQRTWIGYFAEELGSHSDENNKFLQIVFYEQKVWTYLLEVIVNAVYLTLYYRYKREYSIKNLESKRINAAISRVNKSLLTLDKLRENPMNKHDANRLFAILDKIKPNIVLLEKDYEEDYDIIFNELREAIEMTEDIANNIKENVCDILGEQGKVNDIIVYNYAVHINTDCFPEDREDEVQSILEMVYRSEIKKIKEVKQKIASRGSTVPYLDIKELPQEYKPIPDSEGSTSGIWYIAAGSGIEKYITLFALNVHYMLFIRNINCRVTIFDRLDYEYSIRGNTSNKMGFHCNQFNSLMNDFKESILFPELKSCTFPLIHVCSEFIENKSSVEDNIKNTKSFK